MVWCNFKRYIHRKDAESAEELFFSFAADPPEKPADRKSSK
jgi:hypothetical protein